MIESLVQRLRERQVILFIGAGVSANLQVSTYAQMMEQAGKDLGFEPDHFMQYGDFLQLAEYYVLQRKIGPLRSWMDRAWHSEAVDITKSEIHRAIVDLDVPIIYTFNYDRWLESAYETFRGKDSYIKIVNVKDLTRNTDGKTQIVKFHGDLDDDESIVLTESSVFERFEFESPLDLKLRSDTLAKSLLFIGYSMSDHNIRYLIWKLHKLWERSKWSEARPLSYLFLTRANPVLENVLESRGIRCIRSEEKDPGQGLLKFLCELRDAVKQPA